MTVFNDNLERDGQIRMCYWISKNMYYLKGLIFFARIFKWFIVVD